MNIHVPAPELQSDTIAITGLAANLDRAKAGLLDRVKELQAEQEDRVSKNEQDNLPGFGNSLCSEHISNTRAGRRQNQVVFPCSQSVVDLLWRSSRQSSVSLTTQIKRNILISQLLQKR